MHLRLLAFVMSFLCEVVRVGSGVLQKQSGEYSPDPLRSAPGSVPAELLREAASELNSLQETRNKKPKQHIFLLSVFQNLGWFSGFWLLGSVRS